MSMKSINIINFIRGIDERGDFDLYTPVLKEAELIQRYHFPATWLLQYDALVTGPYVECLQKFHAPGIEYGIWLEIDRYLAEAADVPWKGRMTWDYYANCAFSMGYTQEERRRMCDAFAEKFREVFGAYPQVMGSWCFDAFTLDYLHEKYNITGACICKDQQGTDGYTLRGGYFANAYYPSVNNAYMPAATAAKQIDVPVFRMLGSDPLHQYDCKFEDQFQLVISLEPVYKHAGGNPEWVDWFLRETFTRPSLAMAYAQVGQENSFSANQIFPALAMQFEKIKVLQDKGLLEIETLRQSAEKFRVRYPLTPATAVTALTDWQTPASAGVWYLCRNYRLNLFQMPEGAIKIRSWNLFDENFPERNHAEPLLTSSCVLETLPLWDSFAWQGASFGMEGIGGHIASVREVDENTLNVTWQAPSGGSVWQLSPEGIQVEFDEPGQFLSMELNGKMDVTITNITGCEISLEYRNWHYKIAVSAGELKFCGNIIRFYPSGTHLRFSAVSLMQ